MRLGKHVCREIKIIKNNPKKEIPKRKAQER
jgi:hypothetical protein